jgi:hypothetical protein
MGVNGIYIGSFIGLLLMASGMIYYIFHKLMNE